MTITLDEEVAGNMLNGYFSADAGYKLVEEGVWEGDGKYQEKSTIFHDQETGKYYAVAGTRTGSYYSDYHVEVETKCHEVKQVEVIIYKWVNV
jgi:hypothetical protein